MTIRGDYVSSAPIAAEQWDVNLRQALVFGEVDDQGTFPNNWDVVPDFETVSGSGYTITKTWKADGPLSTEFDPAQYLDDIQGFVAAWMGQSVHSAVARVTGIRLYPCAAPSGNSIGGNYCDLTWDTPIPGGGSGNPMPLENSVVLSWETQVLGPRGKGRIYSPVPPVSILTSVGTVNTTPKATYLSGAVDLIEGLAWIDSTVDPNRARVRTVVTGPSSSGGKPPYTYYGKINGARVGEIVDTQRRRRNQQSENYSSAAIVQDS